MENRNKDKLMLGVRKKKAIIKRSKKNLFNKVAEYLKSDCFLYAPTFTFDQENSAFLSPAEFEVKDYDEEKEKSLVKKVGDYIKSDCYMYAPVADSQFSLISPPASTSEELPRKVTAADSTKRSITKDTKQGNQQSAHKKTGEHPAEKGLLNKQKQGRRGMSKRTVYQNCRPSLIPEKAMLNGRPRNVAVE